LAEPFKSPPLGTRADTTIESSWSNGIAEAFVKTFKRDYVRINPLPDARTFLAAIEGWFEDYNEVHPHRSLAYQAPREYIRALSQPAVCLV
jgi:transposase InsO family protein